MTPNSSQPPAQGLVQEADGAWRALTSWAKPAPSPKRLRRVYTVRFTSAGKSRMHIYANRERAFEYARWAALEFGVCPTVDDCIISETTRFQLDALGSVTDWEVLPL